MSEPLYRFVRVLEYVGPRSDVDKALELRQVKGVAPTSWNGGRIKIYEGVLGDVPQQVDVRWMRELVRELEQKARARDDGAAALAYEVLLQEMPL